MYRGTGSLGHFDFCANVTGNGGCASSEGVTGDTERSDGDDNFCFPGSEATRIQVSACLDTHTGFDGVPYKPVWPDGNTTLHATPIQFSSPQIDQAGDEPAHWPHDQCRDSPPVQSRISPGA